MVSSGNVNSIRSDQNVQLSFFFWLSQGGSGAIYRKNQIGSKHEVTLFMLFAILGVYILWG